MNKIEKILNENKSYFNEVNKQIANKEKIKTFLNNVINEITESGLIRKEYQPIYFEFLPSALVGACNSLFTKSILELPVINENGEMINTVDMSDYISHIESVDVDESVFIQYPEVVNDLLVSRVNYYLESVIAAALELETNTADLNYDTDLAINTGVTFPDDTVRMTISNAIKSLDPIHQNNVSIVVPNYFYPLIPNEVISKYNVYSSNVENMYVGDLKSLALTYFYDKISYKKEVKKGISTVAVNMFNINCKSTSAKAMCKIELN